MVNSFFQDLEYQELASRLSKAISKFIIQVLVSISGASSRRKSSHRQNGRNYERPTNLTTISLEVSPVPWSCRMYTSPIFYGFRAEQRIHFSDASRIGSARSMNLYNVWDRLKETLMSAAHCASEAG